MASCPPVPARIFDMAKPWFYFNSDFSENPKIQTLTESLQRRLVMLLCEQCKPPLNDAERAYHWRVSEDELQQTKAIFLDRDFIDENWNPIGFDKASQPLNQSTVRTRRYRARHKAAAQIQEPPVGGDDAVV